jgi:hypothetical protein
MNTKNSQRMTALLSVLFLLCVSLTSPLIAQTDRGINEARGLIWIVGIGIIILIPIAITIMLLVWVARDAKNRGMGSGVGWMVFVIFFGLIALFIYLLTRPKGKLVACPKCDNWKLEAMTTCPHCGSAQ